MVGQLLWDPWAPHKARFAPRAYKVNARRQLSLRTQLRYQPPSKEQLSSLAPSKLSNPTNPPSIKHNGRLRQRWVHLHQLHLRPGPVLLLQVNEQFGHAACVNQSDYRPLAAPDFGVLDMDNISAFAIMGGT
ncbi:hypothetical protein WHR41_02038 [Cladosporium halotolerans]|uniref:Uncharacterized protein n=1 Tax=Cladosporium halotolerans TaxID=1052096 RepID=A0AB34KZU4_9PEZI